MRKTLLVALACLVASTAFGQLKLGAEAGVSIFNISHTHARPEWLLGTEENVKSRVGIKLGIIAEYKLPRKISVQTGMAFVQKGFRYAYTERYFAWTGGPPQVSARIDYLEVPVSLLVGVGKHLRLGAGGYFGYGIGGKAIVTHTGWDGRTMDTERELTLDNPQTESMIGFRRSDYGLLFSASYTLPFNTVIQAQFSKGLKDIMPDIPFHVKTETFKNWGFIVSAGWYLF